jgi:DNA replication and repair protein RecF
MVNELPAARLCTFAVRDFRNIEQIELEAPPGGFAVVGENGQGKTNLLEAIYYCHLFRSMRGGRDADLVRFGARAFHVAAQALGTPHAAIAAGYERGTRRKKIVLDGVECTRLSEALGALPAVALSPSDVEIVSGAPALRRRFLDVALASTSRSYLVALQQYRAALVRRNAALRAAGRAADTRARIAVWDVPLARHGAVLYRERAAWTEWARGHFATLCADIGEHAVADLRYRSTVAVPEGTSDMRIPEAIAAALAEHQERDMQRGLTHCGPHRDDLDVRLGTHALRTFGSAGQQRTAAIALRLLESRTYLDRTGREPILLLDDPFAELDPGRAGRILGLLTQRTAAQSIFAVPRPDDIPEAFTGLMKYRILEGSLTPW